MKNKLFYSVEDKIYLLPLFFYMLLIIIPSTSSVIISEDNTYLGLEINIPTSSTTTFNNNSDLTNASNYWDNLDTINSTQMIDSSGTLTILESWLNSLFVKKTGDSMTGNLSTTNWFNGLFNFVSNDNWINFNGSTITFNNSKIDDSYYNLSEVYNRTEIDDMIPSLLTYYFWDVNSTVNTSYFVMNTTQNLIISQVQRTGLINGDIILYRINKDTNLTGLNGGTLHGHTTVKKTSAVGSRDLQIKGQLFKRLNNGTIIFLTETSTTPILEIGIETKISIFGTLNQTDINVTDMLLWRLVAVVTGGGTAPSVNVTVGGNTNNGLDLPVSISNIITTSGADNMGNHIANRNITNVTNIIGINQSYIQFNSNGNVRVVLV